MKYKNLLISIMCLKSFGLLAQYNKPTSYEPNIVPPSPTAASLNKFVEMPISYYNGLPEINLPLYTVVENSIKVPITLAYHPSGIRVSEEASQVGLGWALSAGGSINRTVMGQDDFQTPGYFSTTNNLPSQYIPSNAYYQNGEQDLNDPQSFQFSFFDASNQTQKLDLKTESGTANEYQPDNYSFSFPGGGGKFIITCDKKIIIKDKGDLIINMIEGPNTGNPGANISFEIITPDGTKYSFTQLEQYRKEDEGTLRVSSWYLTKIVSQTTDEVDFSYNTIAQGKNYPIGNISQTDFVTFIGFAPCAFDDNGRLTQSTQSPPTIAPARYISTVYLSKIAFSNGYVNFNFGSRDDLAWDKKLESIDIYAFSSSSDKFIKKVALNYGYFEGTADNEGFQSTNDGSNTKRLKLNSVYEVGNDQKPVLLASYQYVENETFQLPAKSSFAIDHWGFYNGKQSNTSLMPTFSSFPAFDLIVYNYGLMTGIERNTDTNYATAFSLKRITYPTGGYTDLTFESNQYDYVKSKATDYSYSRNIPLVNPNSINILYNMSAFGTSQDYVLDLSNMVNYNGYASKLILKAHLRFLKSIECTAATNESNKVTFEVLDILGQNSYGKIDMLMTETCKENDRIDCAVRTCPDLYGITFNKTLFLSPGKYILRAFAANGNAFSVGDLKFNVNYYEPKGIDPGFKEYAGGLRIKKISTSDGSKTIVKKFEYTLVESENNVQITKSSGRLMTMPQYTYAEDFMCESTALNAATYYFNYMIVSRASNSTVPLNSSASGAYVGYDKVTVYYGENGENGKSEYYYDNQSDKVFNYSYTRSPAVASLPYEGNGNLLNQIDYKSSGGTYFKVKELINDYYLSNGLNIPPHNKFQLGVEFRPVWYAVAKTTQKFMRLAYFYPAIVESFKYNIRSTEKIYDSNTLVSTETTKKTNYNYQVFDFVSNSFSKTYMQPVSNSTTNSKNESISNSFKYPYDFVGNPIYDEMISKNIVNTPIEEISSLNQQQTARKIVNMQKTNGFFVPQNIQTQRAASDPIFTEITFNGYNSKGKPTAFTEISGITTTLNYFNEAGKYNLVQNKTVSGGTNPISTQYDYYPLVGLKQITEPTGIKSNFEYDGVQRLKNIKDNDGNLLKSYQYQYAIQTSVDAGQVSFDGNLNIQTNTATLNWQYVSSPVTVLNYEISKSVNGAPASIIATPTVTTNTLNDIYNSNGSTTTTNVVYQIRAILSDGTATAWQPLTFNIPSACGNGLQVQVINTSVLTGGKITTDTACYEIVLDEGFESDISGEYSAVINN